MLQGGCTAMLVLRADVTPSPCDREHRYDVRLGYERGYVTLSCTPHKLCDLQELLMTDKVGIMCAVAAARPQTYLQHPLPPTLPAAHRGD